MEPCVVLLWFVCGVAAAVMAAKKGYSPAVWLVLGFLFGVFSVVVVALLPDKTGGKDGHT